MIELLDATSARATSLWRSLEARADVPYFLSSGWLETWVSCLPRAGRPRLLVLVEGGQPVAGCFLGRDRVVRHHLVSSDTLFLNTTGSAARDDLCIEHNQVVVDPARRLTLAELIELLPGDWDELALPALDRTTFPGCALDEPLPDHQVRVDREVGAPFVDLARVRATPGGHLALLAANTRAQVRRAARALGPLVVEIAPDAGAALEIFAELVALHGASWRARGEGGAFADPWIERFHRALIAERFAHGELQLVRVRAGGRTVGCLYNFVHRGVVSFYQSGLASFDDPHVKPGYVCHAEAVALAAAAGHRIYDFLGGDARYKRSLATGEVPLVWARLQRRRLRFAVEEQLRRWKRQAAIVAGGR